MKYFIPKLESSENLKVPFSFKEKLGGIPFGLIDEEYPFCKECGIPMSLLSQFEHNSERLNLGREGRAMFVFQCNNEKICEAWDAESGANSCFIAEPENLTGEFTKLPEKEFYLEKEKIITNWVQSDDGISENLYDDFFDDEKFSNLAKNFWEGNSSRNKTWRYSFLDSISK